MDKIILVLIALIWIALIEIGSTLKKILAIMVAKTVHDEKFGGD